MLTGVWSKKHLEVQTNSAHRWTWVVLSETPVSCCQSVCKAELEGEQGPDSAGGRLAHPLRVGSSGNVEDWSEHLGGEAAV